MKRYYQQWLLVVFFVVMAWGPAQAAKDDAVNPRIAELEKRVAALEDFSQKLQAGVNEFSKNLVRSVDQQISVSKSKLVVLTPTSSKVIRIDTNTGMFLISVQRMDKIDKGYRLYLQIGNPNAASFGDLKLRVYWGQKWVPANADLSYDQWRQTLQGAEYVYAGLLESGVWTNIAVDLKPADYDHVQYIECEMTVDTVKLQKVRNFESDVMPR